MIDGNRERSSREKKQHHLMKPKIAKCENGSNVNAQYSELKSLRGSV